MIIIRHFSTARRSAATYFHSLTPSFFHSHTPMRTLRFTLAYDGTSFHGWQFQHGRRTVQGCVMDAVRKITGEAEPRVRGSSRTDTGVHALGQLAAVWTESGIPVEAFPRAMNANLPPDILVLNAAEESPDFHPISDTVRKRYRYIMHDGPRPELFLRNYCWRTGRSAPRLDVASMILAAECLVGTHDFAAFENKGSPREHTVRTIFDLTVRRGMAAGTGASHSEAERPDSVVSDLTVLSGLPEVETDSAILSGRSASLREAPVPAANTIFPLLGPTSDFIILEVEADGFLYNMVRNLAGTLYDVGRGRLPASRTGEILASRDRNHGGMTAPPQGLFLMWVKTKSPV